MSVLAFTIKYPSLFLVKCVCIIDVFVTKLDILEGSLLNDNARIIMPN